MNVYDLRIGSYYTDSCNNTRRVIGISIHESKNCNGIEIGIDSILVTPKGVAMVAETNSLEQIKDWKAKDKVLNSLKSKDQDIADMAQEVVKAFNLLRECKEKITDINMIGKINDMIGE